MLDERAGGWSVDGLRDCFLRSAFEVNEERDC